MFLSRQKKEIVFTLAAMETENLCNISIKMEQLTVVDLALLFAAEDVSILQTIL